MPDIDSFKVGGTTYDLNASQLKSPASIDGIQFNSGSAVTHYTTSDSTAKAMTKTANVGGGFTLAAGAMVAIKFNNMNQSTPPTYLNVNDTGAHQIMMYGTEGAGDGAWADGETVVFWYDGTYWQMLGGAMGTANVCGRVKVDTTLENAGEAADAKTVGDEFSTVSQWLNADACIVKGNHYSFAKNSILSSSGNNMTTASYDDIRIRTINYLPKSVRSISCAAGYQFALYAYISADDIYDGNDTYIGVWQGSSFDTVQSWNTSVDLTEIQNFASYRYRLVFSAENGTDTIAIADASKLTMICVTDDTLTKAGVPADAKTVGDVDSVYDNSIFRYDRKSTNQDGMYTISSGGINISTGSNINSNTLYMRSGFVSAADTIFAVLGLSAYEWMCWSYTAATATSGVRMMTDGYVSGTDPIRVVKDSTFSNIRFSFRRVDGEAMTDDASDPTTDAYALHNALRLYYPTIPPAPTTDGTYTLQVTVTDGVAVYSWV